MIEIKYPKCFTLADAREIKLRWWGENTFGQDDRLA